MQTFFMSEPNPILVEVSRGDMVESYHRGAAAVVGADGKIVAAWGDVERPVYARSAIKPLQALALVESGAADRFKLGDEEIALACASHSGESAHIECVTRWLARIGLTPDDLECAPHLPLNEQAAANLLRTGAVISRLHNNCSGKHAGFLTTALHLGEPTGGYLNVDHPVQRYWQQALSEVAQADLKQAPAGVDGCGIPVRGLSLRATATAMAQLADPSGLTATRAAAVRTVVSAMTKAPFMVAGSGRFCTEVIRHAPVPLVVKTGAEGVFTAAVPGRGIGIALKIDDGAARAAAVALGAILVSIGAFGGEVRNTLADHLQPVVCNRAGLAVGHVRPVAAWLPRHIFP
jgi:L-asparaginase II